MRLRTALRKRTKAEQPGGYGEYPLREFVYLDEMSLYSLFASRLGAIPDEFTDVEGMSRQSEVGSSVGANLGGAGASVDSRVISGQNQQSQVVRRSIVQTTFRQFYDHEKDHMATRMPNKDELVDETFDGINTAAELAGHKKCLIERGWLIGREGLTRGTLLEMEVELKTEWIFRFSKVFQELIEIIQEDPTLFEADAESLSNSKTMNRVIQRLLSDLVPIRGRAIDYVVIELDGEQTIVHRKLLDHLTEHSAVDSRCLIEDLYIVGVTEQTLYWKNIRQVLFSNAQFRVMCRMEQPGIQRAWTALKLQDVLNSVFPEVGEELDRFKSEAAFNEMVADPELEEQNGVTPAHDMMLDYTISLAADYDLSLEAQHISEVRGIIAQNMGSLESVAGRKQACVEISEYLSWRFDLKLDPQAEANRRMWATRRESDALPIADEETVESMPSETSDSIAKENLLDTEIIAIYW